MVKHLITSNEYHSHGRSLNYQAPCGMKGTIGVWHPGEIIEVSTTPPEIVKIIRNRVKVTIPGLVSDAIFTKHDKFYLPGDLPLVQFEALDNNHTPYECIFYQEELDSEREKTRKLIEETMQIFKKTLS